MSRDKFIKLLQGEGEPIIGMSADAKRALLFRRLLVEKKIDVNRFNELLKIYIDNVRRPRNKFEEMACRGNLMRELSRPELSEKVLKRGLDLLQLPHSIVDQPPQ